MASLVTNEQGPPSATRAMRKVKHAEDHGFKYITVRADDVRQLYTMWEYSANELDRMLG